MNRFLLISFLFIAGCSTSETKTKDVKNDTAADKVITTPSTVACYLMANGKDTATIKMTVSGPAVSGTLMFNLFQKDKNNGEFSGIMQDTLIVGNYTFQSEGMTSVREVVFKIKDDKLYEGYGEVIEKDNGVSFTDITKLKYQPVPFTKVRCK